MSDISEIIFTSDVLAGQHVKLAQKLHDEPGIGWGIDAIDRSVIPMRGGDIGVILGRPGDGKTSALCYHASHHARLIESRGMANQETVVYVTWEGTVDKIYAAMIASRGNYSKTDFHWGRVSIDDVNRAAIQAGIMPVTFIGFSAFRKTSYKYITLPMVLEAIEAINSGYKTPQRKVICIYGDYLQVIPVPGAESRMDKTTVAINQFKTLGMRLDIPSLVGAQAGRQVDSYNVKLATAGDAQHSSSIEQDTDYGWSIWRPIRTEAYDPNTPTDLNIWGRRVRLTPTLCILKNWKQREDQSGFWWDLHFRPELLQLAEIERDEEEVMNLGMAYDE